MAMNLKDVKEKAHHAMNVTGNALNATGRGIATAGRHAATAGRAVGRGIGHVHDAVSPVIKKLDLTNSASATVRREATHHDGRAINSTRGQDVSREL